MTTMTTTPTRTMLTDQEVLELEKNYWEALKDRDIREIGRMTAEQCLVAGASGASMIDPRSIGKMVESAEYRINGYRIEPLSTKIAWICDDTVALAYRVHEDLEVDGKPVGLDAFDTSVWKKDTTGWTCLLHTESIAGDAFGRDRMAPGRN